MVNLEPSVPVRVFYSLPGPSGNAMQCSSSRLQPENGRGYVKNRKGTRWLEEKIFKKIYIPKKNHQLSITKVYENRTMSK